MAFADSDAVFASRAKEIGLDEKVMKPLNDAGFTSMATFAFSCAYIPGTADETPFVDMLKTALKRAPELAETARLRRLFHESYAVVSADLKDQVEQSDDAGVRKLAAPERAQRHKAQQERLQGIDISGANAPGDSLVDKCVAMYEADHLSYISWPHCVSRDHELQTGTKRDTELTFDNKGMLRMAKRARVEPMACHDEIQLRYALIRRGLALEQANVLSFKLHDRWAEKMFQARRQVLPAGYAAVTLRQLEEADKRLWALLAEKTRGGIKMGADGRPCDSF